MSIEQFKTGLENIQQNIIENLREYGIEACSDNFLWNSGRKVVSIPEAITLEIKIQQQSTSAKFAREQLEDSWERIDRPEVAAIVKRLVAVLVSHKP